MNNPFKNIQLRLPWSNASNSKDLPTLLKQAMSERGNPHVKNEIRKLFKKDPGGVMANIMRQQRSLYTKDMEEWQAAHQEACNIINPQRVRLIEFYKDMELDPFIYGIVYNKRILKISNKKLKVEGKAEGGEWIKDLRTSWFNDYVKYIMQSRMWGHSLVYVKEMQASRIKKIDLVFREHVIPQKNIFVRSVYDPNGFDYTLPPWSNYMMGIGKTEDLGLYEKAAIHYILKKHSWRNWDEFEEIFGVPIRIAKVATQDKRVLAEVESWLAEMGTAAYGIFPQDAELDIKENTGRDSFQVFLEKIQLANFELEVLLTGQNRVTQKNGSFAKEKAMDEEADEVTEDDKMFVINEINDYGLPFLRSLGYPIPEGECLAWDDAKRLSPKERLELFTGVSELGFELDAEQVSGDLGVKILGKKEVPPPAAPPAAKEKKKPAPSNELAEMLALHREIEAAYFKTKIQD